MFSFKLLKDRIKRGSLYILGQVISRLTSINKKRVFMWSYHFDKYSCNPKYITEYLLKNFPDEYEIYWAFKNNAIPKNLDKRINIVKKYTLAYFKAMYSSKFVITNLRNDRMDSMFKKKRGQKYIMTWHASFALKKVEKDAAIQLGAKYVKRAKDDSRMCDLMLSNSKFTTNQLKNSFWYDGEILEKCIPRNSIFYDEKTKKEIYKKVRQSMGFESDCKIVLYAPTFRGGNKDLRFYQIDWDKIIPHFENMLGDNVKVLLRLHPNMTHIKDLNSITNYNNVYDVTQAPDITDFMFAADAMISDYTSAMFDFIILGKPCFIYAIDKDEYDRGFYWKLEDLPFPLATNTEELARNIDMFDSTVYRANTEKFKNEVWGLDEDGMACERLYNWMNNN